MAMYAGIWRYMPVYHNMPTYGDSTENMPLYKAIYGDK